MVDISFYVKPLSSSDETKQTRIPKLTTNDLIETSVYRSLKSSNGDRFISKWTEQTQITDFLWHAKPIPYGSSKHFVLVDY